MGSYLVREELLPIYFFDPPESSLPMSLFLKQRDDSHRYKVSVVNPNDKKVESNARPASKGKRVYSSVVRKSMNVIITLMMAFLGLLTAVGTAAPANANFVTDGFKTAFCSTGMFNYELETRRWGPLTGNERTFDATPYEKYGTAGMQWTVWLGPEEPDGMNGDGTFGGISIVNFTDGAVEHIGDKTDDYEKLRGFYNIDKTCVPVMNVGATAIANALMVSTAEVVHITNIVYQIAYESSANILNSIEEPIKTIVTSMRDAVFFEFLTPIIMISALWMAWTGLVKKSSIQAAQGALWMILAAIAAVALMTNPMWLPKTVNTVVSTVSEAGMTAVTSTTVNGAGEMCKVDGAAGRPDNLTPGKSAKYIETGNENTRKIIRQMQCTMWYSFMYTPWSLGQFGDSPSEFTDSHIAKKDFRANVDTINGQRPVIPVKTVKHGLGAGNEAPANAQSWALYHLDNKVAYPTIIDGSSSLSEQEMNQQKALVNGALSQLHVENYNKVYKGDDSMNRLATATIGMVAALGAGIMIVIVSMSIIVLDVGLVILTLVSPLFFLVGVHPGFGRRIALGWVETILGLAMKRVVLSLLLSVMLVFYATILSANASMPWLFSMILVIAVSIGGITYKDQILKMFNKINLGGDGGVQPQNLPGAEKAKSAAFNMAKGAAGMAIAGKIAIRNGRGTEGTVDGSGAGKRKNPTVQERAAAEVLAERNAGAGARPAEANNKRTSGSAGAGATTGTAAGAGAAAGAAAGSAAENANAGVGGGAGARTTLGDNEKYEPNKTVGDNENDRNQQLGGAGHYTAPDGRIVDADGKAVPMDQLTAEEKAVLESGGAGTRVGDVNNGNAIDDNISPSAVAIARMKSESPAEIKKRAEAEAKRITERDRVLPPMRPTASLQASAIRQNAAISKEKKRLQAKNPSQPVTSAQAMKSIQAKERAANVARIKRNENKEKLVQKKRAAINEPLKELRTMANSADQKYTKGYVKKTVNASSTAVSNTGKRISASVDRKAEQAADRRLFEAEVSNKVWEIRARDRAEKREVRQQQKSIPKPYRHLDNK